MVCHTENIEIVNRVRRRIQAAGGEHAQGLVGVRSPPITESEPALRAMYLAEKLGARVYFPHISSRKALDEIRCWRKRYDDVIVETCPHYLTHTEDSDLGGMGKANPPFRTKDDQDALWEALADGTVDVVASDHVPRKKATKDKPLWLASQGFPGTATHPAGAALRGLPQAQAAAAAHLPAARARRRRRSSTSTPLKGSLAPGADADFTLVDLNKERVRARRRASAPTPTTASTTAGSSRAGRCAPSCAA